MSNDVGIAVAPEAATYPLALYHLDGAITFEPVSREQSDAFKDHWLTMIGEDPDDYR